MFRTPAPELDMRAGWRAPELVRVIVNPLKVGRLRRVVTLSTRIGLHAAGAVIIAVCVAVMLWNDIGPGPLDVFIAAVRSHTGLPLMFALWATIGALTLLAWMLGRRPGFGTVLGPFVVGPTMQTVLHWLERYDPPSSLLVRLAIQFLAVGVVGIGVGAINAGRLGVGTGELLAAATSDRIGHPEQRTRMALEVSWLAVGVALGGPIGLGTVVVALFIGKSIANGRRIVDTGIDVSRRQIAAALRT
jgi:uncharacterized membrane protein YczE